ncbi:MAG: carboxymuconolactone decarboxylase family protein [Steroidobacteraceae bacterium]
MQSIEFDSFAKSLPEAVAALRTLGRVSAQDMEKGQLELVKVRASQINGCAYCLQLHLNWARQADVPQSKLDRVAVWREAPGFTDGERAALAYTEALSDPNRRGDVASARQALDGVFSQGQLLRLTVAIATINAWNRIAGALEFSPPQAE